MRLLARWMLVSLLSLGAAMMASYAVLLIYARREYAAREVHGETIVPSGISASEYFKMHAPLITDAGRVGLLVLLLTALYWLVAIRWLPPSAVSKRLMPLSLIAVPLLFALLYGFLMMDAWR